MVPPSVLVSLKVVMPLSITEVGTSTYVARTTSVSAVVGSFGLGSSFPITVTELRMGPTVMGAVAVTVTEAVSSTASRPPLHVMVFCALLMVQPESLLSTVMWESPVGRLSVSTKPELMPGPSFVTTMSHSMVPPTTTRSGPVLVTESDAGSAVLQLVALLRALSGAPTTLTSSKEGLAAAGLVTETWYMLLFVATKARLPLVIVNAEPYELVGTTPVTLNEFTVPAGWGVPLTGMPLTLMRYKVADWA